MTTKTGGALLLFALVALVSIFLRPLLPVDETRYVGVAWEMFQSHDFFVPTKNFEIYTHKPPLLFWSINLVWAIFGVSEFSARLVGPGFALLAIFLTARLARQLWPQEDGIAGRAAWALAGTLAFAVFGGSTMFDAVLTVGVLFGALSLVGFAKTGQKRFWLAFGASLAFGTLAKGPVIFIHLLPAALSLPFWARHIAPEAPAVTVRQLAIGMGIAIASGLVLVLVWLLPAIIHGGEEYRNAILWKQSAGRIAKSFAHSRPIYWYALDLPLLLFPWIWIPQIWRGAWRASWSEPGLRLVLIWVLSAFVLFSLIDGKQFHYLLPELPAVALLVARVVPLPTSKRAWLAILPVALFGVMFILAGLGIVDAQQLTALIDPNRALLATGLGLLAVCGIALNGNILKGGAVLSFGLVLCVGFAVRFTDVYHAYDAREIGQIVADYQDKGIAIYGGTYNAEFNFAARVTRPLEVLHDLEEVKVWQEGHPEGVFISRLERFRLPEKPWKSINFRDRQYGIYRTPKPSAKESLS
ncbi:MAG: hypothetical protein GYB25_08275 [Rhodobacteraceae bacterium]|nr:hypothetical protein [Paracoccaceae bacterium]